jgi:predicted tellurium resistance membrane protein TerC
VRWLVYAGAGILVYVAVEMFFEDSVVHGFIGDSLQGLETPIALVSTAAFVALAWFGRAAGRNRQRAEEGRADRSLYQTSAVQ